MEKKLFLIFVMLCSINAIYAQNDNEFDNQDVNYDEYGIFDDLFSKFYDIRGKCSTGQILYYSIQSDQKAVEIIEMDKDSAYSAELVIPATVSYEGKEYTVSAIRNRAFFDCRELKSIRIPASIISIGKNAWEDCPNITSITVDQNNPIYDSRNKCNAIIETATNTLICGCSKTVIPNSVVVIGNDAFSYCSNLVSINIPESVTYIGDNAFRKCYSLKSIKIPNSVTYIGNDAFYKSGLTSIDLPNSINVIRRETFGFCPFTSFNIPNSVTKIEEEAFQGCSYLTTINIPSSVTYIGAVAFDRCSKLSSVNIPQSVTYIGPGVFSRCENLTSITVDKANPVYHNYNNKIIETATNTVIFSTSHSLIIGEWELQEVQAPHDFKYNKNDSTDYDPYYSLLFFYSDGPVEEYNNYNNNDRWDSYQIYNDTVLVYNKSYYYGASYKIGVIKKLTKEELCIAYNCGIDEVLIYKYVRNGDGKIRHTQHNLTINIDYNSVVKRLSNEEISQDETPAAVSYNFVSAIFNSDRAKMLSYLTTDTKEQYENVRISEGYSNYDFAFSKPDSKLNIKGWKTLIASGNYEIAVLFVQNEWFDEYGRVCKKVYVDCVPSAEVNVKGFQDINRVSGTNVKVLVVNDNGKWKVIGFK